MAVQFVGLLVLAVTAFAAPLIARLIPRRLVPPVVLEVVGGIVIGPQVLGLVRPVGGGFGFLVPVFFIVTGVQFNLKSLFASPSSLALVPGVLVGIMIARVLPALMYRRRLGTRPAIAAGFLQATTLTFPVVVAEVGVSLGLMTPATSAALVGAALLSVLIFPVIALVLRPWTPEQEEPALAAAGRSACE